MSEPMTKLVAGAIERRQEMLEDEILSVAPEVGRTVILSTAGREMPLGDDYKSIIETQLSVMREIAGEVKEAEDSRELHPERVELVRATTRRTIQMAFEDEEVSTLIFVNNGGANHVLTDDRLGNRAFDALDLFKMAKHLKRGNVYQVGPWFIPRYAFGERYSFLPYGSFLTENPANLMATYADILPDELDWRDRYGAKQLFANGSSDLDSALRGISRYFGDVSEEEFTFSGQSEKWVNHALQKRGYPYAWHPGI